MIVITVVCIDVVFKHGKLVVAKQESQGKKSLDVGDNLFTGNLDPDVDEQLLCDTFSAFGVTAANPKAMTVQYLCNRQITVSYPYKKDAKGERHGTSAERFLAATNPSSHKSRPHSLFASRQPMNPNALQANGVSRPYAYAGMQPVPIPAQRPPSS